MGDWFYYPSINQGNDQKKVKTSPDKMESSFKTLDFREPVTPVNHFKMDKGYGFL